MTNASMQAFILRRLRASAVFLRPFEKLTRKLLKAALQLFGTADDRAVRVHRPVGRNLGAYAAAERGDRDGSGSATRAD